MSLANLQSCGEANSRLFEASWCALSKIFLLFCFFPWVSFSTNNLDTQPWHILLGLVMFFGVLQQGAFVRHFALISLLPIVASVSLFFDTNVDFLFLRAFASYLSFAVVLFVTIGIFLRFGFPFSTAVVTNIVYLIVALAQLAFGPTLVSALTSVRTTDDRGMTSLAVEPTFFGLVLFFYSWIYLVVCRYKPTFGIKVLIAINVCFIVFVAQSAMGILFLLLAGSLMMVRVNWKITVVVIFGAVVAVTFMGFLLLESRVFHLLDLLKSDGLYYLLRQDASINSRIASVLFPLQGAYMNMLVPAGFHSFENLYLTLQNSYNGLFWYGASGNKIMSFVGAFLYELGFFGFVYLIYIFWLAQDGTKSRFLELGFLFAVLNSAIPIAFPFVAILLALMILVKKNPVSARMVRARSI